MRSLTIAVMLLYQGFFSAPSLAQTQPTTPPITRSVLAQTKVRLTGSVPHFFRTVGIVVPMSETSSFTAVADGILYEMSGSTVVTVGGTNKDLNSHEAVFIAAGTRVVLKVNSDNSSTLLHFMLCRSGDLDRSEAAAPATTIEVFRTPEPIPGLKSGQYDLNLTLVTFPPHMPSNAPHHRTGAALYYVLSGTGANTVGGKTSAREGGSVIYEPSDLVHQWSNPGDEPLRFIAFNINAEGTPAVVPSASGKAP